MLIWWDTYYTAYVRIALLLAQGDVCCVSVPPLMGNTRSVFDRLHGILAIGMVAPACDLTLLSDFIYVSELLFLRRKDEAKLFSL